SPKNENSSAIAAWASAAVGSSGKGSGKGVATFIRASGLARPADALRGVLELDAFVGQLRADRVGTGEIARLLGRRAFVDQRLDARIVLGGGAACEPRGRILLQQPQR